MSASTDPARLRHRAWLLGLVLYGLGSGVNVARHLAEDLRTGNQAIELAEVAVAFSAGLFWPIDVVAAVLLSS
jgi:hypothetical protein